MKSDNTKCAHVGACIMGLVCVVKFVLTNTKTCFLTLYYLCDKWVYKKSHIIEVAMDPLSLPTVIFERSSLVTYETFDSVLHLTDQVAR